MISALLLPFLLAEPHPVAAAAVSHDDPPIQLWISNDRRFLPGERAKVQVRTEDDGYLLVIHVDPDGYLRVLFPLDPDRDNFVRGGKKYEVKGRGDREAFESDATGRGTVYAAVSREPFRFDSFVIGDHWDYRTLAPSRLSSNPEAELNELVRKMALGDFDYDLLSYDVVERAAHASTYAPRYYGSVYHDPWCYRFSCGRYYSSTSVLIVFGRPYRRYYYDPYFYAYEPFYNPFFYDPYYYAPAYYPRYLYPRRYFHDPYWGRYYYDRHPYYGRPYTPYRFRVADDGVRYRDRRYDLGRSVNTVYNRPISPVREPSVATPARRVIESPGEDLPSGVARRRLTDDARRVQARPVEARRAQTVERDQERSAGEPRLIRRAVDDRAARDRSPSRSEDRPAPRQVERRPVDRGSAAAPQPARGSGRAEGRSSGGGSRESGGSKPSSEGGRRRR